ncbi:hypothetical protein Tco_1362469 [Tanacetum coccineum]
MVGGAGKGHTLRVVLGKDGKPIRAMRCVQIDATKGGSENVVSSPAKDIPNSSIMKDVNDGVSSEDPKALPAKEGATAARMGTKSYVNVVAAEQKTHKINFRTLINKDKMDESDCVLPVENVMAAQNKFGNSLVGFFVEKSVAFPLVQNYVTNTWSKFRFQKVMRDDDDVFYFKFTSTTGLEQVLEQGPSLIRNQPLILTKWTPNLALSKDKVTKVPVWMKIHKVPVVAYSEDGLSLIATQIGKPIMLDSFTSSMCTEPWGRLGFAHALIEVTVEKELKQVVTMAVPIVDGEGYTMKRMSVEYEWKPSHCTECLVRKKGKKVGNGQTGHTDGFKFDKQKPKYAWNVRTTQTNDTKHKANSDEGINLVKLKNHFNALQDQDGVFIANEVGESSRNVGDTSVFGNSETENLESESEVEEMANEYVTKVDRNAPMERQKLWTDLEIHKNMVRDKPWVLLGDFNVALNMEDIFSGSSKLNAAMCDFKDCVKNIKVFDINSSGLLYTWNQKPKGEGGILKKLDRIMGNIEFVDMFPGAYALFQPYRISDHALAVLKIPSLLFSKPKPFKFYNFLAHKDNFVEVVFMQLDKQLDEVQKAIDLDPSNRVLRDEEAAYIQAFNEAKIDEERFLRQKAKIEWLEVGDSNSAYFHKSIKCRNQRSRIDVITTVNDVVVHGNCVPDVFVSHYESFIGMGMVCEDLNISGLFNKQVSEISNANMIRIVTNEEIKRAMFYIGDDKPRALTDFFDNGQILKEINHTFLALIPKVTTPLKVNDYKPISCCNVIYKCISKILTNRIIEGIKEELMHNYHRNRGPPRCAFKVDIQKAYDTVDWRFLGFILKCFGFHHTMIKWIMTCVTSASFSISGNIHGFFKTKKRDGFVCRYLPLSIINCEDWISFMFAFADNLFIFSRGDVESARAIMDSLDEFKHVSGLVPSIPKSTAFFCNVVQHVKNAILSIMPFSEGEHPVKYLGVPLISSRLLNKDCKFLVEKARNRIGDWKNKSLSFAGRLQLCKSVISSMQVYWASVLVIPMGIISDIQQLIQGFLWCNGEYRRGKAKVAWDDICVPKHEGGLGLRSLECAWEVLRPRGQQVMWYHITWFSNCIPRHAFHLWLVMRRCLKMQDKLRSWDVDSSTDISQLQCSLCGSHQDSHKHLFFECTFSSQVLNSIRNLAGMEHVPSILEDIVMWFNLMANNHSFKNVVGKLLFAGSSYYIWIKRNNRLFKNSRRSPEEIRDLIMTTVRLKLVTFRFKNILRVQSLLSLWKMPSNFRIYGC